MKAIAYTFAILTYLSISAVFCEAKHFQETDSTVYLQFDSREDTRVAISARSEKLILNVIAEYIAKRGILTETMSDRISCIGIAEGLVQPEIVSSGIKEEGGGFAATMTLRARVDERELKNAVVQFAQDVVFFPYAVANRVEAQSILDQVDSLERKLAMSRKAGGPEGLLSGRKQFVADIKVNLLKLKTIALNSRIIRKGESGIQETPEMMLSLAEKALPNDASNPWLLLVKARAHSSLKEVNQAVDAYKRAIVLDPYFFQAYYFRGVLYSSVGAYDLAVQDFDISISLETGFEEAYIQRGIAKREIGKVESAIWDFKKALRVNPESAFAFKEMGVTYLNENLFKKAVAMFDQAVEFDPGNAEAYLNRGVAYSNMGQTEGSCRDFRRACELGECMVLKKHTADRMCVTNNEKEAALWSRKSYAHVSNHRWTSAISAATIALSHDPELISAYINRGWALAEMTRLEEALLDCNRAIQLDPNAASAYNNRGLVYHEMGALKEAQRDYLKACSLGLETGCNNYLEGKN